MTIEQVLRKYPSTEKKDWKQYKNSNGKPGGWVHKDASITPIYPLFIGEEAVISGGYISGGDISGGDISGGYISGGDISGGDISGGYIRGGDIRGGVFTNPDLIWHIAPIQIVGNDIGFCVHQSDIDKLRVGCQEYTFKQWQKPGFITKLGRERGMSDAVIKQYKAAILYCISQAKFTKVELKKK